MDKSDSNKNKLKKQKRKLFLPTNPEPSSSRHTGDSNDNDAPEPLCPLLAKDSEWVDIMHSPGKSTAFSDEEEVVQLVESEDGPGMKPLAIMFPGLLEKDPQTLEGMLTKAMSTTEVTKHLVDLGQKANFTFMKKASRLIPPGKKWLGAVSENSDSNSSIETAMQGGSTNDNLTKLLKRRIKKNQYQNDFTGIPGKCQREL